MSTPNRPAMFASLAKPNYRHWIISATIANTGTWMQRIAQDWLVLTELTNNSGFAVGVVTGLQFLPLLLMVPISGLIADRYPRRKILFFTQSTLGILAAALGALVLFGHVQLWHVYVLAFLLGVVTSIDNPVRQTFVSELVGPNLLTNAVALNSASFNLARMIGPAIAGLAIAAVGSGWVFVLNAVSFGVTLFALARIDPSKNYAMKSAVRKRGQMKEGFQYLSKRPELLVVLLVIGVVGMMGLNFQLTSAMMARTVFEQGAGGFGLLASILSIGSLAGSLLAARRERPTANVVVLAALLFGASLLLTAIMPNYWLYALMGIPTGFFTMTLTNSANASVQLQTPEVLRGRVMSVYMAIFAGTTPIGSPIIGWIGETFGARWSVGVGGVSSVLIALIGALWLRRIKERNTI